MECRVHADLEKKKVKLCIFALVKVKNQEITEVQNNYQIHKQTTYEHFIYDWDQINLHFKNCKFQKKFPNSCHFLHTKCETTKSKPMHKTQILKEGSFCCLTLHGVSFVRLQLNKGTIQPNFSIKICNPFYFNENNTIIIY